MNEHARTGRMQGARDLGADAPCAAGDQDHLAARGGECLGRVPVHASERYRIVPQRVPVRSRVPVRERSPWGVNTR